MAGADVARTRRAGVALLLAGSVVAGCGGIPEGEPLLSRHRFSQEPVGQLSVVPEGPRLGDTPDGIVRGFLLAAAGFAKNHEVARSFLTRAKQSSWQANTSVTVYPRESSLRAVTETLDGRPAPAEVRTAARATASPSKTPARTRSSPVLSPSADPDPMPGATGAGPGPASTAEATATTTSTEKGPLATARTAEVVVRTPVVGTVDAAGSYTAADPGTRTEARFTLERDRGQWRISGLADGILLSETLFTPTYRTLAVYFPDRSMNHLVPDLRWFPSTDTISTAVVESLLSGPSAWLGDAVITGVPERTRLAVPVVVESGEATIDLTAEARTATPVQRQLLTNQLRATLGQLRLTARITVERADFAPVPVPGAVSQTAGSSDGLVVHPEVSQNLVVLDAKGRLSRLEGSALVPVPEAAGLRSRTARRPAVSLDGRSYAVLTEDRDKVRYVGEGPSGTGDGRVRPITLISGARLTSPSFDPYGWVWTVPSRCKGWVLAARPGAAPVRVKAPRLDGQTVLAFRVSWDGARAIAVVRRGGRTRLLAMAIVRALDRVPQRLDTPIDVLPDLVTARDAVWADAETVVVLGRRTTGREQPWRVVVGGQADPTDPLSGARTIAARIDPDSGQLRLYAGTSTGEVHQRQGATWPKVASASWPTYPG
ncbi:MAG: hypothetical protein GXX79_05790 [Actinomycetales bacterium]|nr:hypothetical protein [Actinomycetales bacterium]